MYDSKQINNFSKQQNVEIYPLKHQFYKIQIYKLQVWTKIHTISGKIEK